jgi:hypothetical protein
VKRRERKTLKGLNIEGLKHFSDRRNRKRKESGRGRESTQSLDRRKLTERHLDRRNRKVKERERVR